MRKGMKKVMGVILAMIMVLGCMTAFKIDAAAIENVTVTGVIKEGSTADLIKLTVDGEEMRVKIDDNTDLTNCKLILTGSKVKVTVYTGNDKYLHASRMELVNGSIQTAAANQTAIISGYVKEGTTSSVLKINSVLGDFNIKIDNGTDLSECRYLVAGKNIIVTCAKDSSGSLYATKIADGNAASLTSNSTNTTGNNMTVSGKITSSSSAGVLYVDNESGTMTIKIDSSTQMPKGVVLVKGSTVTCTVYTGADKFLHAEKVVQSRSANSYKVDSSKLYKVTGKVGEGSTTDMIKFVMSDGEVMNLKLDDNTTCADGLVLGKDTKLSITCGRGEDAYMHAVKIDKAN